MRMPPSHPTPSPLPAAHPFPPQTHHHHHQKYTLQFAGSGVGQTDVTFQSESRDLASDLLALPSSLLLRKMPLAGSFPTADVETQHPRLAQHSVSAHPAPLPSF